MSHSGSKKKGIRSLQDIESLAESGSENAQVTLALMNEIGLGKQRDKKAAKKLWLKASKQGSGMAKHSLAAMLERGEGGKVDLQQAAELRLEAEQAGCVSTQSAIDTTVEEQSVLAVEQQKKAQSPSTKAVLIVDDSRSARFALRKAMEVQGFRVIEAESGRIALDLLIAEPDTCLVISDVKMPDMDGLKLLQKIRSKENFQHIPLIFCTSEARNEQILKARNLGVSGYIVKPPSFEQLKATVEQVLKTSDSA